jgi:protein phosphatase
MESKRDVFSLMTEATGYLDKPFLGRINRKKVAFIGDTHGNAEVTRAVIDKYYKKVGLMVFLGDYVDRGEQGVENLSLILSKFIENPKKLLPLRGNHELRRINEDYGFMSELERRGMAGKYNAFEELFSVLPYAVVVNGYLCVHGGIASDLKSLSQLTELPFPEADPKSIPYELMWNDPSDSVEGFGYGRGERSYSYGKAAVERFLKDNRLKGIIRGHQKVDGFKENIDGKVITVYSAGDGGRRVGVLIMDDGEIRKEYLQ